MRSHLLATVAAGAVLLAACGGDDPTVIDEAGQATTTAPDDGPTNDGGATSDTSNAPVGVEVGTASTDLGTVLVDAEGRTLYLFDNDAEGESSCYDACAETWPPLTGGEAAPSGEVDPALLGTTERDDGTVQVTYGGWPLYLYAADEAPGDTNGQGVGDVWWAVQPSGERVTGDAEAEAVPADAYDY